MLKKGDIIENMMITGIAAEGKAVGRVNNFVVFVEDAVPGDEADVRIFSAKKTFAEGKLINLRKPSSERTEPVCSHFGTCGGCKWQHLSYARQLDFKKQQVQDAFQRIGHLEIPALSPILSSKEITYYRNKLEFTFSNRAWVDKAQLESGNDSSAPALGFHVPLRFDKVLDIDTCYLQPEPSNAIRKSIRDFCIENGLSFYDLKSQHGMMRNLIIRNTLVGEWMVVPVFHEDIPEKREQLLQHILQKFPFINSLQYIINSKINDTIFDLEVKFYHGKDHIIERMEGLTFRISAKSFYQTNPAQAYELYKIARDFAGLTGNENVYDLYTGTGTIACFVSKMAGKVTGIDSVEDAIADARTNALENSLSNAQFFAGDMKSVLNQTFIETHGKPDVIITDPPRAGMHSEVVESMKAAAPKRIVYISCNPSTQARDLQLLNEEYRIQKIQPVDMFPHTSHVENVVLLSRKENPR